MNWEVEFTDQAKQDLRDILDYITYELQEPKVAVNLVRQITKEIPIHLKLQITARSQDLK